MSVPSFRPVSAGWWVAIDGGLASLAVLAGNERAYRAVEWWLPVPDQRVIKRVVLVSALLHVVEANVAFAAARKAGADHRTAKAWAAQTMLVGFPSLLALRSAKRA